MADGGDVARYQRNRQDEVDSATVYMAMADAEPQPQVAEVYRRLAETERNHAAFWAEKIREVGGESEEPAPSNRARVLAWLARRFGPDLILPTMRSGEVAGGEGYATQPEVAGTGMTTDERSHDRLLTIIAETPVRVQLVVSSPNWRGAIGRRAGTHFVRPSSARTTVSFRTSVSSWAWPGVFDGNGRVALRAEFA